MTRTVLLGDIISDIAMGPFGSNLKVDSFTASGVPIIKGGNLYDYEVGGSFSFVSEEKARSLKRSLAYPDDIVITHRGTLGQISIVPHGKYPYYLASQSQLRITPDKNLVNPRYLLYYLRSTIGQHELMQHTSQVGVPSIATPTKAVKSFKVLLPELPEQEQIVNILGTIDEKIELNRKMNETLDQTGQTLFRHYFIDNPAFKDVPKVLLGSKIHPKRGKSLTSKNMRPGLIPVVSGGLRPAGFHVASNTTAPVITVSASGANAGYIALWGENVWSADSSFIDQTITDGVYFFYILLKMNQGKIYGMQTGAAQPHISPSHLELLEMPDISQDQISDFNAEVVPFFKQITENTKEIQTLTTLRDTLLPRLINGKVKV